MAEVLVQISGVLYDKLSRTERPVLLQGAASLLGLGVGGGPVIPPEGGGGLPDHIWGGGNVPMPTPPIANVPGAPGYRPPGSPPGIWGGPIDPYPGHPLPEPPQTPPEGPPDENGFIKPPPEGGGWAYHEKYAWMYDPPAGAAQPK